MPNFILLPATGSPADKPVFALAVAAARQFGSHLAFLHVRPDVRQEIAAVAATDMTLGGGLESSMASMEAEADAREHGAEQAWRQFCLEEGIRLAETPGLPGISAEWLSEVGSLPAWLGAHGRAADLVVTGRGREGGAIAMDVMETALLETGRPVLIASDLMPGPLDACVAIAWKDTREAAGAVAAALPFISKAQRVVILTVEEVAEGADRSERRLLPALRWSNPNTSVQRLKRNGRPPVNVLLEAATAAGASLLVMGGYGHARLREAVFGGFTRAVLHQAPLPVLMAH
jgi:nucleotide-binding universal stress UspA family protein